MGGLNGNSKEAEEKGELKESQHANADVVQVRVAFDQGIGYAVGGF